MTTEITALNLGEWSAREKQRAPAVRLLPTVLPEDAFLPSHSAALHLIHTRFERVKIHAQETAIIRHFGFDFEPPRNDYEVLFNVYQEACRAYLSSACPISPLKLLDLAARK